MHLELVIDIPPFATVTERPAVPLSAIPPRRNLVEVGPVLHVPRPPRRPSLQVLAIPAQQPSRGLSMAAMFLLAALALAALMLGPAAARADGPRDSEARLHERVRELATVHAGAIDTCYQRALVDAPELAGRLVLAITVEASGAITSPEVLHASFEAPGEARGEAPGLIPCIVEIVGTWRTPPRLRGPVRVVFPIDFEPRRGPDGAGAVFAHAVGATAFRTRLRSQESIRTCYEALLVRDGEVEGSLVLRARVNSAGAVVAVDIEEAEIASPVFRACVLDAVREVSLPTFSGSGETSVGLRFSFAPRVHHATAR